MKIRANSAIIMKEPCRWAANGATSPRAERDLHVREYFIQNRSSY